MNFAGYKINNGSMTGLTRLQQYAILIMDKEKMKWNSSNKAMPAIVRG